MRNPPIVGKRRSLSASNILAAVGDALSAIKHEDELTYGDMGAYLGKSEDMAAKYADGTAEMGVTTYARAKAVWSGRFTGRLDALLDTAATQHNPKHGQTLILHAALSLSQALEDGELTPQDVAACRSTLESARDAIDSILKSAGPRAVSK